MTISKGELWGVELERPPSDAIACADDAALAATVWERCASQLAERSSKDGSLAVDPAMTFTIGSGDMLRTIGGPGSGRLALPMDICEVRLDDSSDSIPMAAHVIGHRRWWQGEAAAVMNAAWLGEWYLGPKAHPNDGLVDVTTGALGLRDRIEARRRVGSGAHLPHPALRVQRAREWSHSFPRPVHVLIDGISHGRHRSISVVVHPDVFLLVN